MSHLPILPILIPMLAGILLLLPPLRTTLTRQRIASLVSAGINLLVAVVLLNQSATGEVAVYAVGDWHPPYGIVLIADRLSALMLLLTAILLFAALLYASAGEDETGRFFYPLMMFQALGINGAFLTGDLFNLFVFFEILLIASYSLLIHGGGKHKTRAAVHYVFLNLVGSAIFLFALGVVYGSIGSLNMADMALRVRELSGAELELAKVGGLLLLVVFGLKAAMLPLQFWLPRTYATAPGPVVALFAILTKVGIYCMMRVHGMIFGDYAGDIADLIQPWLWATAILTIAIGAIGALSSPSLKRLAGHLVIVSVGTLLSALAINTPAAISAALYYAAHSTLAGAALFLVSELISEQRGGALDMIVRSRPVAQPVALGITFFITALALIGMPPFSGFIGKLMVMQSATTMMQMSSTWPTLLIATLFALVAFSRAGSTLFWRATGKNSDNIKVSSTKYAAIWLLLLAAPLMSLFAGPIVEFTAATAAQLDQFAQTPEILLNGGNR
ncbi:MAG TPA: monovalent cation/H+ antiporter subunit D [Marinobacterium sp.]|nr:monovalent cation/H+ antiporter subunit D [Marinobacterium sp.]